MRFNINCLYTHCMLKYKMHYTIMLLPSVYHSYAMKYDLPKTYLNILIEF